MSSIRNTQRNMPHVATRGMHKQVVAMVLRPHYLRTTIDKKLA